MQNKFCRYVIGGPSQAANVALREECGRFNVKTLTMYNV